MRLSNDPTSPLEDAIRLSEDRTIPPEGPIRLSDDPTNITVPGENPAQSTGYTGFLG